KQRTCQPQRIEAVRFRVELILEKAKVRAASAAHAIRLKPDHDDDVIDSARAQRLHLQVDQRRSVECSQALRQNGIAAIEPGAGARRQNYSNHAASNAGQRATLRSVPRY